ncbi:hypothetical protein C2E23DRAFT_938837 [Lenzites betulinus]|nr:hypothetical protein C2E23DRAFT_938837 [Lenzites betulinus]
MPVLIHQYATVLANGDVLMRTSADRPAEVYCAHQARLFLLFDKSLRTDNNTDQFDAATTPIPGGYDQFAFSWNLDTVSPYSFATYNPDTEVSSVDIRRDSVPQSMLIPTLVHGKADEEALSTKDRRLLQDLLKAAAERKVRQRDKARDSFQERQKKRDGSARRLLYSKGMSSLAGSLNGGRGNLALHLHRRPLRARSASPTPTVSSSTSRITFVAPVSGDAPPPPPVYTAAPAIPIPGAAVTTLPAASTALSEDTEMQADPDADADGDDDVLKV